MSRQAKKCIYYAHIYSHLSYANTVWDNSVTSKQKKNIKTIQKYCIRAIQNKPKTYPTANLFKNLQIMRFTDILEYELCKLGFSLKEKLLPVPLIDLFENYGKNFTSTQLEIKICPILKDTKAMNTTKVSYARA